MIGDLIGKPGRVAVEQILPDLRDERGIDFVTANGENVAGGMGLTPSTADAMFARGRRRHHERQPHLGQARDLPVPRRQRPRPAPAQLRHARASPAAAGAIYQALDGTEIAVINLQGRTYMQPIENPFTDADALLDESSEPLPPVRLVDFHCELTSEKNALGLHLDGRVSVVVGTHTHVVTGDERILPGGTAYQTDLGMTGPSGASSGSIPRPSCRGSSTPCRPGSRSARGRSSSTPPRSTSTRRPAGPSRSSGSSGSSRSDGGRPGAPAATARRPARRPPASGVSTVDLHTHTLRSDGVLQPVELVRAAAAAGVTTLAITDHDTLAGYRELVARPGDAGPDRADPGRRDQRPRARASRSPEGELHILGFGMDPADEAFEAALAEAALRAARSGSSGRSPACASSGCRSTPSSATST